MLVAETLVGCVGRNGRFGTQGEGVTAIAGAVAVEALALTKLFSKELFIDSFLQAFLSPVEG